MLAEEILNVNNWPDSATVAGVFEARSSQFAASQVRLTIARVEQGT
jgi:hypothetical protein